MARSLELSQVDKEYELCFKCHSSWTTQPDSSAYFSSTIGSPSFDETNPLTQGNKATELNPNNSAYHPVEAVGKNQSSNLNEQLAAAGLSTTSTLECTDCHYNVHSNQEAVNTLYSWSNASWGDFSESPPFDLLWSPS